MSYSVDWIAKVITIPTADLTLVSGTRYSLDMADFLAEIRRLEWSFTDGLWAPSVVDHTDTRFDFAGADYAPFDDLLNDYTVQFSGVATRVDLLGSNNNLIDVLIATGVSVVPSNSAGLQVVAVGSGVTQQDKDDIEAQIFAHAIEATETFEQQLRLIRANAAGSIRKAGDVYRVRDAADTKDRITATATATDRDVTAVDGT